MICITAFGYARESWDHMYVCICNALTDTEIAEASRLGARTVKEAYAALGVEINCGQCACLAKDIIKQNEACVMQAAE